MCRTTTVQVGSDKKTATDTVNTVALEEHADSRHFVHVQERGEIRSYSHAEVNRRASAVAGHLLRLGMRAGDRIGIVCSNGLSWVVLDLAILKIGAVVAGFEPGRFPPEELMRVYGLKLLFGESIDTRGSFYDVSVLSQWTQAAPLGTPPEPHHRGYDAADILALRLTSGSTGHPKGLEVTAGSVNASLAAVQDMFSHDTDDNILVFFSLGCSIQQRYWIYSALAHGHDVTISDFDNVLATAQLCSATVVMGVPGFYEDLKARVERQHGVLDDAVRRRQAIEGFIGTRIRYLWTGSAPASRAVLDFFNGCGMPLYEGYGLTETCIVAKNHPNAFRIGSVGRVLPGKTVRIDKDGVVIVGGQAPVNSRYTWCGPGESEKMFLPTAEVRTHDLGHIDEDGYLYIHGRVDDVVVLSGGLNVLVRTIEDEVRQHPDVHECVVFGQGHHFLTAILSLDSASECGASLLRHLVTWNLKCRPEQRIGAVIVAAQKFSVDNGMLTTQLKPKRKLIHAEVQSELNQVYRCLTGSPGQQAEILVVNAATPVAQEAS